MGTDSVWKWKEGGGVVNFEGGGGFMSGVKIWTVVLNSAVGRGRLGFDGGFGIGSA